jgi:hypothetical protein
MFEDLRQAFDALLHGNVAPGDRRALLQEMRETLVRAKMALDDMRQGVRTTQARLERERGELVTVQRRRTLAEGIGDAETVSIAMRFEAQHLERVGVLERKLEAALGELALGEREVEEMTAQFKAAHAGAGSGLRPDPLESELPHSEGDASLDRDLRHLDRERRKAANEADADARLAELKRRMGL